MILTACKTKSELALVAILWLVLACASGQQLEAPHAAAEFVPLETNVATDGDDFHYQTTTTTTTSTAVNPNASLLSEARLADAFQEDEMEFVQSQSPTNSSTRDSQDSNDRTTDKNINVPKAPEGSLASFFEKLDTKQQQQQQQQQSKKSQTSEQSAKDSIQNQPLLNNDSTATTFEALAQKHRHYQETLLDGSDDVLYPATATKGGSSSTSFQPQGDFSEDVPLDLDSHHSVEPQALSSYQETDHSNRDTNTKDNSSQNVKTNASPIGEKEDGSDVGLIMSNLNKTNTSTIHHFNHTAESEPAAAATDTATKMSLASFFENLDKKNNKEKSHTMDGSTNHPIFESSSTTNFEALARQQNQKTTQNINSETLEKDNRPIVDLSQPAQQQQQEPEKQGDEGYDKKSQTIHHDTTSDALSKDIEYSGSPWGVYQPSRRQVSDMELLYMLFRDRIEKEMGIPLESSYQEARFPLSMGFVGEGETDDRKVGSTEELKALLSASDEASSQWKTTRMETTRSSTEGLNDYLDGSSKGLDQIDQLFLDDDSDLGSPSLHELILSKGREILMMQGINGYKFLRRSIGTLMKEVRKRFQSDDDNEADLSESSLGKQFDWSEIGESIWMTGETIVGWVSDFVDDVLDGRIGSSETHDDYDDDDDDDDGIDLDAIRRLSAANFGNGVGADSVTGTPTKSQSTAHQ